MFDVLIGVVHLYIYISLFFMYYTAKKSNGAEHHFIFNQLGAASQVASLKCWPLNFAVRFWDVRDGSLRDLRV